MITIQACTYKVSIMQSFPTEETTFLLPGPAGNIEILTTPAIPDKEIAATAIICHPHPLHGGTMTNKVVTTLARVFYDVGLRTVRFNFRGVGQSEGVYDHGIGETEDVIAIANWLKKACPGEVVWLAGFSFGGFVAARAATRLPIAKLITVAPQASRFQSETLPAITCPWLIIQGEQDEVVSPTEVYAWVETLDPKPTLVKLPSAGHFFHGQLMELRKVVGQFLT